jgi:hypothetical protein
MNTEQFEQIVEAILAGKYSWACVLLLRFAGYNPLHYIPYRTYNRLLKENCQAAKETKQKKENLSLGKNNEQSSNNSSKIQDLPYLDLISNKHAQVREGGMAQRSLDDELTEYICPKVVPLSKV